MILLLIALFALLVFVGAVPFIVIGVGIVAAVWGLAYILCFALIVNGAIFKRFTGRDARVRVSGSLNSHKGIEAWMQRKGYIRFG